MTRPAGCRAAHVARYPECPLGIASHGKRLCTLHRRLDEAAEMVENALGETMLADLLSAPASRKPLCRFPAERAVES